jgi:proline iminopeptidase
MRCLIVVIGFLVAAQPLIGQTQGFVEGRSRLYYESLGRGPETIVVVHGGPALAHDYMRPEWDQLGTSGRVIYYDQNGCGKSERVPPYGWRSHVEDLDRLLDSLAPHQHVVLAGSSWGSMLALYYTYQHPERVKALILSGVPLGIVDVPPKSPTPWRPPSRSRLDSVNRGLTVGPGTPRPPLESRLQQRIKEDCADVGAIISMSLGDAPRSRQLEKITVPTLVLHGSNPEQMSGDGGPGLAAILPNAKLVTIADAAHDPWLDQPKVFFAAANSFLRELQSTRPDSSTSAITLDGNASHLLFHPRRLTNVAADKHFSDAASPPWCLTRPRSAPLLSAARGARVSESPSRSAGRGRNGRRD